MKKYIYLCVPILMFFLFVGCSPEENSMGSAEVSKSDLQEGIAFSVTPDSLNPNLIHLKNLKSQYNAYWIHPDVGTGHSKGNDVDLKIAFAGVYSLVYGLDTSAGMIYSDTVKIIIKNFCADFVSGDNWTWLAGGASGTKTWVPDNGKVGMKQGFYSCFAPQATYGDMTHDDGLNNWYAKNYTWWEPSNADVGNTDGDLAQSMTFSLKGGAYLTVVDQNGKESSGSFAFTPDSHTLSAIGVEFPHGAWANGKAKSFSSDFYVFHLSENQLMIANLRDKALSGEDPCWYVWNFVSKDYKDNYKGETITEPKLPSDFESVVGTQTNKTVTWVLSSDSPYDWMTLAGKRKNGYSVNSDYPVFMRPLTTLGDHVKLTMNSEKKEYKLTNNGDVVSRGTYILSDKGIYTFSSGLGSIPLGGTGNWITLSADANNQLRIMQYDVKSSTGKVNNLWLGAKDMDNSGNLYQYLGYHFVAVTYGDVISYDTSINYFDTGWNYQTSPGVDVNTDELSSKGEEKVSLTLNGSSNSPYGIYIDVMNILSEHPNATLTLDGVSVDGTALNLDWSYAGFTKTNTGTQLTGDLSSTARIYLLNPWDTTSPATQNSNLFKFANKIEVTFTIKLND